MQRWFYGEDAPETQNELVAFTGTVVGTAAGIIVSGGTSKYVQILDKLFTIVGNVEDTISVAQAIIDRDVNAILSIGGQRIFGDWVLRRVSNNINPDGDVDLPGGSGIDSQNPGLPPRTLDSVTVNRRQEVAELFDVSNPRSGIHIGDRVVLPEPNSGGAVIFDGVSEAEVMQYFAELTGVPVEQFPPAIVVLGQGEVIPVPITVLTPERQEFNLNLRDFATSETETGPVFTIDIPGEAIGRRGGILEIKFLRQL